MYDFDQKVISGRAYISNRKLGLDARIWYKWFELRYGRNYRCPRCKNKFYISNNDHGFRCASSGCTYINIAKGTPLFWSSTPISMWVLAAIIYDSNPLLTKREYMITLGISNNLAMAFKRAFKDQDFLDQMLELDGVDPNYDFTRVERPVKPKLRKTRRNVGLAAPGVAKRGDLNIRMLQRMYQELYNNAPCAKCSYPMWISYTRPSHYSCSKGHGISVLAKTPARKSPYPISAWAAVATVLEATPDISTTDLAQIMNTSFKVAQRMRRVLEDKDFYDLMLLLAHEVH